MNSQRSNNAWIPVVMAGLMVAGCASDRQRTAQRPEEVTRATASVEAAEKAGAYEHGSVELNSARRKLSDAETALKDGDRQVAAWLGQEADLDAQLAIAKARNAEMQAAVAQIHEGTRTLQEEARRGEAEALGRP